MHIKKNPFESFRLFLNKKQRQTPQNLHAHKAEMFDFMFPDTSKSTTLAAPPALWGFPPTTALLGRTANTDLKAVGLLRCVTQAGHPFPGD